MLPVRKETMPESHQTEYANPFPSAAEKLPVRSFEMEVIATVTHPVSILGKEGFTPSELTIQAGDSITWANADPRKKDVVLTFEKQGVTMGKFSSSSIIPAGKEETIIFSDLGTYVYWTTGYGIKGKLTVEQK